MRLVGSKSVYSKDKRRLSGFGLNFTYDDRKLDEGIGATYLFVNFDVLSDIDLIIDSEYEVIFNQFHEVVGIKLVG